MSKSQAGSLGGRAVVRKYGKAYMSFIGARGALVMWCRWRLVPVGPAQFKLVRR